MGVNPTDPGAGQASLLDHGEHLVMGCQLGWRQVAQKIENLMPLIQPTQGELTHHKRMGEDRHLVQHLAKPRLSLPKVVDPN